MKTTERQAIKPAGLARFLVAHRDCAEGYETLRDRGVVTVICRGCDASFSFLTSSPEDSRKQVEEALVELAEASGPERPARNGASPEPKAAEKPPAAKPIHTPPAREGNGQVPDPKPRVSQHRFVRAPGPLAPKPQVDPPMDRLAQWLEQTFKRLVGFVDHRRRPIALAALGLAGAYVLLGLAVGDEPSSSQSGRSLGGPQVPVDAAAPVTPADLSADNPSVAGTAAPTQSFQAGGPELQAAVADEFTVAVPPDWGSSVGDDDRTLLGPSAGGAEIEVIATPRAELSVSEMASEGTALLAEDVPPGQGIQRLPAQPVGNLIQVALTNTPSALRTAYVGFGQTTAFVVISHIRNNASTLVREQAQSVIASFAVS